MRYLWMLCAAAGLLLLAGCGSAAPDPQEKLYHNGPALVAVDEPNEQNDNHPDLTSAPKEKKPDLRTMTLDEEASYALFCNLMSESGFRDMLRRDNADLLPDRMAYRQGSPIAYYNSMGEMVVICDESLSWFQQINTAAVGSMVRDAMWLDENGLLLLTDDTVTQQVCLYRPATQQLDVVYSSPEGRIIRDIVLDEAGEAACRLAPQEPLPLTGEPGEEAMPLPEQTEGGENSAEEPPQPTEELVPLVLPETTETMETTEVTEPES